MFRDQLSAAVNIKEDNIMDKMTTEKYQLDCAKTFKKHEALSAEEATQLDWALGIGGEAGEVLEIIKHHIFSKEPLNKMKLAKELGDVVWYIVALASTNGIKFEDLLILNRCKLEHRYEGKAYDHENSANRHSAESKFEDTELYKLIKDRIDGSYVLEENTNG